MTIRFVIVRGRPFWLVEGAVLAYVFCDGCGEVLEPAPEESGRGC